MPPSTDDVSSPRFLGRTPVFYGSVSLIAGCFAVASQLLVVVIGIALSAGMMFCAALVSVIAGVLGIAGGFYYRNVVAVGLSVLGLGVVAWGILYFVNALTNF